MLEGNDVKAAARVAAEEEAACAVDAAAAAAAVAPVRTGQEAQPQGATKRARLSQEDWLADWRAGRPRGATGVSSRGGA